MAVLLVTGGMAAAGASALNQYLERVSDGAMRRTQRRPLVTGAVVRPKRVLIAGSALVLLPSVAVLPFNSALAFFLIFGAFIYVGVYTIWLKPRTSLNIVIGGAAGSAAVLSGGAAVSAWREPAVLVLALLIFLWTPTHFWSLAILYHKDYRRAGVPMLPAKISSRHAALWVLVHTLATTLAALALGIVSSLGWIYLIPVAVVSARLLWKNLLLLNSPTPGNARALFMGSNIFLMIVLLAACISVLLPI